MLEDFALNKDVFWASLLGEINLSIKTGSVLRNQSTAFSYGYVSIICGEVQEFNKYYIYESNKYI
jgi:hypothetical protein